MSERKARAANGDRSNWGKDARREYNKYSRIYTAAAVREEQDPQEPDEIWLANHLRDRKVADGRSFARRYARNIGHYLTASGQANLVDGRLVRAVLNAPDEIDPFALDLDSDDLPFGLGRAQAFVDDAYRPETYAAYSREAVRWKKRCDQLGIDWLRPPEHVLGQYLEERAVCDAFPTLNNRRSALSHHFRKNGVPDVARAESIDRILQGVKRAKPRKRLLPVTAEERRAILAELEEEGAGVRDRCCVLITAFTNMAADEIALIDVEHCTVSEAGVKFQAPGEPAFHVGRHRDRDLDLVVWLTRLLELVPSEGPLFRPVLARRMRFDDSRLSTNGVLQAVRRPAERAEVSSPDISARLRALFAQEVQKNVSSVVFYHSRHRRTLPDDPSAAIRAQRSRINKAFRATEAM